MKKYYYFFWEKLLILLHKDPMKYRLKRYRLSGANIGKNVRAFSPITAGEPYLITIEDNVTISTGVKFLTHDNSIIKHVDFGTDLVGKITIKRNCFVGANALFLPGVSIGENSIVGAGAVVTKSFPSNVIIGGNPAKIIGNTKEFSEKSQKYVFDFRDQNRIERKKIIENSHEKWLDK